MTIEEAVCARLLATSAVTALVGQRVYPDQAPDLGPDQTQFPRVVYSQADRKTVMTHSGPVALNSYAMDLTVDALTKTSAKATAKAVGDSLKGYRGTQSGLVVLGIFDTTEGDGFEPPQHAGERGTFSVTLSVNVWFRQP